jgi:hypothetical protein
MNDDLRLADTRSHPKPTALLRHTSLPHKPCHPSAWHKEEAECKHFLVVASDEKPRQKLLQAAISGMAVGKSKPQMKEKEFAFAHRHRLIYFFFPARQKFLSRLSRSVFIFCSLRGYGKKHTTKKSMHGLMAAIVPCGGTAVAAMPFFRARLVPRQAPPHPHTPGAGALADARVG